MARLHWRIRNQRNDFVRRATTDLVGRFDLICIEDLNLKGRAETKLSRSVLDAALNLETEGKRLLTAGTPRA